MEIRDAVEADAERLANLTGAPTDVMRNVIHDRTVRVAPGGTGGEPAGTGNDEDGTEGEPAGTGDDEDGTEGEPAGTGDDEGGTGDEPAGTGDDEGGTGDEPAGTRDDDDGIEGDVGGVAAFVSFDAQGSTVHVTQLEGDPELCTELLAEPRRFAEREGMDVELLVAEDEDTARTAAEAASFEAAGSGPRFGGTATTRYRWRPDS